MLYLAGGENYISVSGRCVTAGEEGHDRGIVCQMAAPPVPHIPLAPGRPVLGQGALGRQQQSHPARSPGSPTSPHHARDLTLIIHYDNSIILRPAMPIPPAGATQQLLGLVRAARTSSWWQRSRDARCCRIQCIAP